MFWALFEDKKMSTLVPNNLLRKRHRLTPYFLVICLPNHVFAILLKGFTLMTNLRTDVSIVPSIVRPKRQFTALKCKQENFKWLFRPVTFSSHPTLRVRNILFSKKSKFPRWHIISCTFVLKAIKLE